MEKENEHAEKIFRILFMIVKYVAAGKKILWQGLERKISIKIQF